MRDASLADAAAVLRVTAAAYEEYRGLLAPPSGVHRETVEVVESFLLVGGAILASIDGEVVGAVRWSRDESDGDALNVGRLAVLPAYRRRGIGRALMAAAEERARRAGLARTTLGVRDQLPQNRAFYEALGYTVEGESSHPGYERTTVFLMSKTLER